MHDAHCTLRLCRGFALLLALFSALAIPIAAHSADAAAPARSPGAVPAAAPGVAPAPAPGAAAAATPAPIAAPAPSTTPVPASDYLIGPGDIVRITVYQSPDLTLDARVAESGVISYPLLGTVRLGGLSVAQAEATITRGLRDGRFLKQPQVTVLVTQVRGNQVSVLGMVNKPGRFPIDVVGMRLSEALALAGGVATGGNDVVTLSGTRNGQSFRSEIDLPALYGRKPTGEDPVLENGDVVFVERAPTVYIYGEVQKPGALRLERDMSVMQALASGGGLTQRGTARGLRVHRRAADGRVQVLEPSMTDKVRDGDVIYVKESLF